MKTIAILLGLTAAVLAQQCTQVGGHSLGAPIQEFLAVACPGVNSLENPYAQKDCQTLRKIQAHGQGKYKDGYVEWTFQNGKAAKAETSRARKLTSLQSVYGEPTFVKPRLTLLYATWCMGDGAKIDAVGGDNDYTAVFYSHEYLVAQAGKTRLGVFRSGSCPEK
jgi:hypothetical protein